MFILMMSRSSSISVHVGSKTRSVGQIIEKPCDLSRGHVSHEIFMKIGLNVHLDNI